MKPTVHIQAINEIAVSTGKILLEFYQRADLQINYKEDDSPPLTEFYGLSKRNILIFVIFSAIPHHCPHSVNKFVSDSI